MSPDEHRSGNSPLLTSKPESHLATPQGGPQPDRVHLETPGLVLDKIPRVRWPNTFWRWVPARPSPGSGPVMADPTEPAGESSAEPHYNIKDWRPVFEEKMQRNLYNLGASKAFGTYSSIVQMGEAYHDGRMGAQNPSNVTHIEKCDYTKAVSPGADFDVRCLEEARKQRIKALQHSIGRSKELDSVAQDYNKADTRSPEGFEERCRNELILLCNYVAPRRATPLHIIEPVNSVEKLAQPEDPSPLMRATEEMRPNSSMPGSPHAIVPIAASVLAILRECSPRQDGLNDWGAGDSKASTEKSASNAAVWRCQSKYNEPAKEEEQRRNKGQRSSDYTNTLSELEEWLQASGPEPENSGRRDSALAGLEETQRVAACETGKVKSPAADRMTVPSSALDPVPVSEGRQHRATKKHTSKPKASRRQRENGKHVSKSMVLEPARHTRPLTATEKGKWVAECECPACQPQQHQQNKRVHFDESAMDKAEEGPGLSHDGFVKTMKENRRRMEARARGEGVSSWATSGPTGLDMFRNPRPAPRVPVRGQYRVNVMQGGRAQKKRVNKHDISEPMDRYGVFPRVHEFPSRSPGRRDRVMPLGEADPMAVQVDVRGRHPVWRTLSKRLTRSMK